MTINSSGSHLDHLLRQTRMHHMQLSSMADVKANILLTMACVVLTMSIGYLSDESLKWAILTLMFFCLATIVLAIYAVMPHLPFTIKGSNRDWKNPTFNILFFGDFAAMSYETFLAGFEEVMSSPEETYIAQIKEVYLLGIFLARKKYRFLRLAYLTFLVGFILTAGLLVFDLFFK